MISATEPTNDTSSGASHAENFQNLDAVSAPEARERQQKLDCLLAARALRGELRLLERTTLVRDAVRILREDRRNIAYPFDPKHVVIHKNLPKYPAWIFQYVDRLVLMPRDGFRIRRVTASGTIHDRGYLGEDKAEALPTEKLCVGADGQAQDGWRSKLAAKVPFVRKGNFIKTGDLLELVKKGLTLESVKRSLEAYVSQHRG